MREFRNKIKRQIEILGLALAYPLKFKTVDLAIIFNCEELTIKRDLKELRSFGLDIHSIKNKGIEISKTFTMDKLEELILQYVGMCYSEISIDKATQLIVKQISYDSIKNIVLLQRAIDNNILLEIDYQKSEKEVENKKRIEPLVIFQADGIYRLLAKNDGVKKQFFMNKILKIIETEITFKKPSKTEIQNLFKYSWKSWIGDEQISIKLKFSKTWAEWLKPKLLLDSDSTKTESDGSIIYETIVNSLSETASWIAGRGKGIVVLEPKELREKVISVAKGVLDNYQC